MNTDHPQLAVAIKNTDVEDVTFRRLAYEVAFFEYAIGLAYLLDEKRQYFETNEPIYDIRMTVNRIATSAAAMYARRSE